MHPDTSAVRPDAPIAEVFAPAAEARLPLAVVDGDGRLTGVVPRVALLEAMAPTPAADQAAAPADGGRGPGSGTPADRTGPTGGTPADGGPATAGATTARLGTPDTRTPVAAAPGARPSSEGGRR